MSPAVLPIEQVLGEYSLFWRHRVSPAVLPIEQVLGEYSLS